MVARIRVITHLRGRLGRVGQAPAAVAAVADASAGPPRRVVVLGASTGGPSALLTVLASLPDGFDLPILVVLHISEPFGQAMAEWLDGQLALEVRYARDGERLPTGAPNAARGCVLMAPPGQHLELVGESLRLGEAPERHSCRPSVDVLFESVARSMGGHAIAALLTGMGRDGAQGLMAIKHQGGVTIAQDEATSIVFGMPGEAVKLGAATHVLGLPHIGPAIGRAAQGLPGQREGGRTT